ncbi:hypothetical protein DQ04_00501120 [Trypanosoma grayi]|uniref:hypothetical protein n=1 Tax=Trypanosoma grayi TaxID=71804 RepID=UPI0004F44858|nr:hypothetical protein DQ04_00501120 [Trypanosoma grayi]KEG14372.1 hypothetical protein DQ04_00501120 [Trypanosoma grayi]
MSNDPAINTALLNFCASLDNGPKNSSNADAPTHRNPEDMQWLKEALQSVEAPERQVRRLLDTVARDDITEDACAEALEELSDLVEDINWAIEFSLMNGHKTILDLLQKGKLAAESAKVRQNAAMVIAHAAQLNERVQNCFEEAQWQNVLVPLLEKEESSAVLAALLHSCSCLCRSYAPNAHLFCRAGGVELVKVLLGTEDTGSPISSRIIRRVLFLITYLADVADFETEGMLRLICKHAKNPDDEVQITAAQTLTAFTDKSFAVVKRVMCEEAPECLDSWRSRNLEEDDCRKMLINVLDKEGHEG